MRMLYSKKKMMIEHQMRVSSVNAISNAVRVRRACNWLLVVQHLVVHALNRSDSDACARPVVVNCVGPFRS